MLCNGENCNKLALMRCPTCIKMNVPSNKSFFCSKMCYQSCWKLHKQHHILNEPLLDNLASPGFCTIDSKGQMVPLRMLIQNDAHQRAEISLIFSDHIGVDALRPFASQHNCEQNPLSLAKYWYDGFCYGILSIPMHDEQLLNESRFDEFVFNISEYSSLFDEMIACGMLVDTGRKTIEEYPVVRINEIKKYEVLKKPAVKDKEDAEWVYPLIPCASDKAKEACEALLFNNEHNLPNGFGTLIDLLPRSISYCILLGVARFVLTVLFFKPFAIYCLQLKFVKYKKDPAIEEVLCKGGKNMKMPTSEAVIKFCKSRWKPQDPSVPIEKQAMLYRENEVAEYITNFMKNMDNEKRIVKFIEAMWRFIFYSAFLYVGYKTLISPVLQPWVLDSDYFWIDWPQAPSDAIKFYYQVQIGAYFHQLLWTEVTRSDAIEMILHHFVTLVLLIFSFCCGFTRIGTFILIIHDAADIFLEFGKTLNYIALARKDKTLGFICDLCFAAFAITFGVTRLFIYPTRVLYPVFYTCELYYGYAFDMLIIFKVFLSILQCLHIFWFYLIMRMVVIMFTSGKLEDIREDEVVEKEKTN